MFVAPVTAGLSLTASFNDGISSYKRLAYYYHYYYYYYYYYY